MTEGETYSAVRDTVKMVQIFGAPPLHLIRVRGKAGHARHLTRPCRRTATNGAAYFGPIRSRLLEWYRANDYFRAVK
jgi:hypothetical protein